MALSDIKALNKSHEIAFRDFIASRQGHFDKSENEEFVVFNYHYKEKIDVKNEKTKLEKFVQEFKNCHFPCVILRYLVLINKELFNRYNYVTKFRFQQITYLNKSPFTTASLFRHSRF